MTKRHTDTHTESWNWGPERDLMEIYIRYTDLEPQRVHSLQHRRRWLSLWQVSVEAQSQVAVITNEEVVVVSFCIHCSVLTQIGGRLANFLSLTLRKILPIPMSRTWVLINNIPSLIASAFPYNVLGDPRTVYKTERYGTVSKIEYRNVLWKKS